MLAGDAVSRLVHSRRLGDLALVLQLFAPLVALLLALRWWRWRSRRRPAGAPAGDAGALVVASVALVVLTWMSTATSLWDRDEPRYATASLEMARSGDLVVPTLNGEPRLHKPAGIYWLMAPGLRLFGNQDWAARLPAMLAALTIILCCWRMGRRLASPAAGAMAALIIAGCPLLLVSGSAATTDAALTAFITLGMVVVVAGLPAAPSEGRPLATMPPTTMQLGWWSCAGLALAIGCAALVKGPLGWLPLLTALILLLTARSALLSSAGVWLRLAAAGLGGLALFAAWQRVPALIQTHGKFLSEGIGKHVIARGAQAMEGHSGPVWYYVPVLVATFFPWTCLLPLAVASLWRGPLQVRALVLAWSVPTFLIFSVYATKLPTYLLPIFPGLALAVALLVAGRSEGAVEPWERPHLTLGRWLLALPCLLLAAALLALPVAGMLPMGWFGRNAQALVPLHHLPHLLLAVVGPAMVLLALLVLGWRLLHRGRLMQGAVALGVGMLLFVLALALRAMPAVKDIQPSPLIAAQVLAGSPPGTPVWVVDYDEPSLLFALDRGRVPLLAEDQVAAWASSTQPGVVVMPVESAARCGRALRALCQLGDPVVGIDIANGHWVELVAFARGTP